MEGAVLFREFTISNFVGVLVLLDFMRLAVNRAAMYTHTMKRFSALVTLLLFAGIALAGFSMMHGMNHGKNGDCLGAIGGLAPCPVAMNGTLADIDTHISALKQFGEAPVGGNVLHTLLLVVVLAAGILFVRRQLFIEQDTRFGHIRFEGRSLGVPSREVVRTWLALLELSPNVL